MSLEMLWHYIRRPRRPSFVRIVRCLMWYIENEAETKASLLSRERISRIGRLAAKTSALWSGYFCIQTRSDPLM